MLSRINLVRIKHLFLCIPIIYEASYGSVTKLKGFGTSDLRFMRRDLQPIELPL
jgi:hypothetical protein